MLCHSSALENKERSITAALENLQREYLKNKELQIKLDEQQKQHKIKEDEKSKAIEVKDLMNMITAIATLFLLYYLLVIFLSSNPALRKLSIHCVQNKSK